MIKIGIIGDIGSGKSYVARQFACPVFNADKEVLTIYKKNKRCFKLLKKKIPKYISSFPIKKKEIGIAILKNHNNLKKIIKIVHPLVRLKMKKFLKKNKSKKMVVLDVPLLLENKIVKRDYILVFVSAKKNHIKKRIVKRKNYNQKIFNILKKMQLPLEIKKRNSHFIISNNFRRSSVNKNVKIIKKKILNQ